MLYLLSKHSFSLDLKGCSSSSYKCANGKCVSKINPECDGIKDCFDGSDELRCGEHTNLANSVFHSCTDLNKEDSHLVVLPLRLWHQAQEAY